MRGRDGDGAYLVQRHHGIPPLQTTLQNEHDTVATLDAYLLKECGTLVGDAFELAVGEVFHIAAVVSPQYGFLVRGLGCITVDDIIAEIEIGRDINLEVLEKVFV